MSSAPKKNDVLRIYLAEYAGIFVISSAIALVASHAAAYSVVGQFDFITFAAMPMLSASILVITLLLIIGLVMPVILRSFNKTANGYLRNE